MRWTVIFIALTFVQLSYALVRDKSVAVVALPLSTVLHPNLQLSFDVAFVCGSDFLEPLQSHYSYFMERTSLYTLGIEGLPGNTTSGKKHCPNISRYSEDEWRALATERYRLQFSVGGEAVFYTEHILSSITNNIELRVTGMPAIKLNEHNTVFLPQKLSFKLYGSCDGSLCSLAHAEVYPTYSPLAQHSKTLNWEVEWIEVPNAWSEYIRSLLSNDDESHIQLSAMLVCFVLSICTALVVMLGIRRKLTPFLKEGSSCWASLPILMNTTYALREMEMNVESGESEQLLSTSEQVAVNLDDASWRLLHGDVMRPPVYTITLATLTGNGVFLIMQVLWLVLFTLFVDTSQAVNGVVAFVILLSSMVLAAPFGAYFGTRVLINVKRLHKTRPPWKLLLLCSLSVPACVLLYAILIDAHRVYLGGNSSLQQIDPVIIAVAVVGTVPVLVGGAFVGFKFCTRFAPLQTLRINPIARRKPKLNIRFTFASMFVPSAVAYTALCAPLLFWLGSRFGARPGYALSLLIVTSLVGFLCCVSGALLVVFSALQREIWQWHWYAYGSGACIFLYSVVGSSIFTFTLNIAGSDRLLLALHITLLSLGLSTMCGAVSYLSAYEFVASIFRNKKYD